MLEQNPTQRFEEEEKPAALQNRELQDIFGIRLYAHPWGWFPPDIQKLEKPYLFLFLAPWHQPPSTALPWESRFTSTVARHRTDILSLTFSLSDVDLAMSAWVKPWGSPELLLPLVLCLSHHLPHLQRLSWVGELPSLLWRCSYPKDWLQLQLWTWLQLPMEVSIMVNCYIVY